MFDHCVHTAILYLQSRHRCAAHVIIHDSAVASVLALELDLEKGGWHTAAARC